MPTSAPSPAVPQITVLDTGGQYCHLITRKIRELGVYADIQPSETPVALLQGRKGLVISGGPHSVYEPASPAVDPALYGQGAAVLGICYGLHLMAHHLGGHVRKGDRGEYGLAFLDPRADQTSELLRGVGRRQEIWMSHRDVVEAVPPGFDVIGETDTCAVAVMADTERRLYGVQFHPEVVHTRHGQEILSNFVFGICGCTPDWHPADRIPSLEAQIRESVGDRNVLFFVSGGVDSTVAYTLCLRALGPDRVRGYYVDTGLMRSGETAFVRSLFLSIGAKHFEVVEAADRFLGALAGVVDPEEKRHRIGEEFVRVQESILQSGPFLDGHWILGQGTIYPDTIESGGSQKADVIKTHHNRVAGIQKLIETGRIVEPLTSFYKDEVREIGRELGLAEHFLVRHPFPGPGLAIRCLCGNEEQPLLSTPQGWVVPVHSVGVQGDSRSYRPVLLVEGGSHADATALINQRSDVNRVAGLLGAHAPMGALRVRPASLSAERLERLRRADALVRDWSTKSGFEHQVWQFPVVLIPLGTADRPDTVVLRPVQSVDGMTAQSVALSLAEPLIRDLLDLPGVSAVLHDLTHKPPGTIEWE